MVPLSADTAEDLLQLVHAQHEAEPDRAIRAIAPDDLDDDELTALCAALALHGVTVIDTDRPQIAKRCLDTYAAMSGDSALGGER